MPLFVWLYCIFWWFLQDAAKVYTFYIVKKYNIFDELNEFAEEFEKNPGLSSKHAAKYIGMNKKLSNKNSVDSQACIDEEYGFRPISSDP